MNDLPRGYNRVAGRREFDELGQSHDRERSASAQDPIKQAAE